MSPRPKSAPDDVILDAAARVLARRGPTRMRLEDVAHEVGLAPATLLLRFRSKRNLLLAVAEHGIARMAEHFRDRRLRNRSALHAVTDVCESVRELAEAPQQLANLLAFVQLSLEDPEFGAVARRHDAALAREIFALLQEAQSRGELVAGSPEALSRAVMAVVRGSLLTWSAIGEGTPAEAWIKADLETLIGPYRRTSTARTAGASTRTRRTTARAESVAPGGAVRADRRRAARS